MRHARSWIVWILLPWTGACATRATVEPHSEQARPAPVMLEVSNRSWHDMDIYLAHGGMETRLGTVTAAAVQRFPAAPHLLRRHFQLVGRVIGSDASVTTDEITVRPGQFVQWVLGSDIQYSSVSVWSVDSTRQ